MCEPATIAMVATAASTVMQGYAAQQQGKYEQGVSRFNARQQENEATRTMNKAVEEENIQRRKTAEFIASQRAQLAAQGVNVGSGSALQLQEDTATLGEIDALRIRTSGIEQSESLEQQADITRSQGDAAAQAGRNAMTGSILTAAGQVAGSGVADKWFSSSSAGSGVKNAFSPGSAGAGTKNIFK